MSTSYDEYGCDRDNYNRYELDRYSYDNYGLDHDNYDRYR